MKTLKNIIISTIALGATLGAHTAQAEVVARLPNDAGSYIYFTDETCVIDKKEFKGLMVARSKDEHGVPIKGCWALDEESSEVKVLWYEYDGQRIKAFERVFDVANLQLKNKDKKRNTSSPKKTTDI